jgi:hypothetical protein
MGVPCIDVTKTSIWVVGVRAFAANAHTSAAIKRVIRERITRL